MKRKNMSDQKLEDIEKRKEEIEKEIEEIESSIDDSIHNAREDISRFLNPKKMIKEFPLQSLGVSVIVGYLLANRSGSVRQVQEDDSSPTLMDLVWENIKKDASQKLVQIALAYLDAKTSDLKDNSSKDAEK